MTNDELNASANNSAAELGHHWIGVEHFVLAILRSASDSPAAVALRACGVSYEALAQTIATLPTDYSDGTHSPYSPGPGRVVAPEGMMFLGRAEGLAAGLGSSITLPEHLLMSLLWEDVRSVTEELLESLGASRARLHEELSALGVPIPSVPLPRRLRWSAFRVVSESELKRSQVELDAAGIRYRIARRGDEVLLAVTDGWERIA